MPAEQIHHFGWDAATELGPRLRERNPRHIFLVTGNASYAGSGAEAALAPGLAEFTVTRFSDFEVNPKIENVESGVDMLRRLECDLVIAVGGGTALDVAKSVRVLAAQEGEPRRYVGGEAAISTRGVPLVAVPTTSGSGSEATQFAVVYVDGVKHSLDHAFVLPDYSVVDPALSQTLPPRITASTGMDALAHSIESYWSIHSTDESRQYAAEALGLVMSHLTDAVTSGSRESRTAMARAAHLAGRAINITRTTACHAISYPITSRYGVPHGHAVALTLPHMLVFNAGATADDVTDERGVDWVHRSIAELVRLLGATDVEGARQRLLELMREISLETSLEEIGINDTSLIVAEGFNVRLRNNPRRLTEESVRTFLRGEA